MMKTLCLCLLLVSSSAHAATYYVLQSNGDDQNTGTSRDKPLKTIGAGIRKLRANDTLVIGPGEYYIGPEGPLFESALSA